MNLSAFFRKKIVLPSLVLIIAMAAAVSLYVTSTEERNHQIVIQTVASTMQSLLRRYLVLDNEHEAYTSLSRVAKEADLKMVIFDAQGQIFMKYPPTVSAEFDVGDYHYEPILSPTGEELGKLYFKDSLANKDYLLSKAEVAVIVFCLLSLSWLVFYIVQQFKLVLKDIHNLATSYTGYNFYIDEIKATQRRILEQSKKLVRYEREAVQAQISRQFAHDIRSPLSALQIASEGFDDHPERSKSLIKKATQRIQQVATDLLDHSRKEPMTYVNLSRVVNDAITEKRFEHENSDKKIDIRFSENIKNLHVYARENDLRKIISNLLNNSIEAAITKFVNIRISLNIVDNNVVLSVVDDGPGIPKEVQEKLGQVEISTKAGGNGLGIKSCFRMMNSWGAEVKITSLRARGTRVHLIFPRIVSAQKRVGA